MTREEEIARHAEKYSDNSSNYAEWSDDGGWSETNDIDLIEKAFKEGAKWADKTMIDKACEWLKDNLYNSLDRDGRPTIDSPSCTNVNEFIKEFRKAIMIDDYEPTESLLDGDFSCETTEDWE